MHDTSAGSRVPPQIEVAAIRDTMDEGGKTTCYRNIERRDSHLEHAKFKLNDQYSPQRACSSDSSLEI